jgi:hypothetical protein
VFSCAHIHGQRSMLLSVTLLLVLSGGSAYNVVALNRPDKCGASVFVRCRADSTQRSGSRAAHKLNNVCFISQY